MKISHVFFDVGGVLGTNGWDHEQRATAATAFGLDPGDLNERHDAVVAVWEMGGMSLEQYLDHTVFWRERPFTREEFRAFMLSQSRAFPETIAVARDLAATGRYRLMTINNESAELNTHRLQAFGLVDIFVTFFTSCWLGVLKPARQIFERALVMSQAEPAAAVFVDDREPNLAAARLLGMHAILYHDAVRLRRDLAALTVAI
ncbi:MAG TPA: HAD-IA family hydrolase [Gemmatimonadales bacterium]|nr:HAD-IA family hydrolase [Gemmatimonadales bacterium]